MKPNHFLKPLLFFFTLVLFVNCSEDQGSSIPDNAVFVPQTELISLTGDSNQLTLTWKPVVIPNFISYKVYRFATYTDENINPNYIVNVGELIYQETDHLNPVYVDN